MIVSREKDREFERTRTRIPARRICFSKLLQPLRPFSARRIADRRPIARRRVTRIRRLRRLFHGGVPLPVRGWFDRWLSPPLRRRFNRRFLTTRRLSSFNWKSNVLHKSSLLLSLHILNRLQEHQPRIGRTATEIGVTRAKAQSAPSGIRRNQMIKIQKIQNMIIRTRIFGFFADLFDFVRISDIRISELRRSFRASKALPVLG